MSSNQSTAPVVLITAGSAGLGAETARLFATKGFRVVINYNSSTERADALLKELCALAKLPESSIGSSYVAIKADLAARGEIDELVQKSISIMGQLDVVFSNGGWTKFADMNSLDDNVIEEDWDRAFNLNVKSHLWLMHAAKKHLEETEGSFISTASVAGLSQQGSSLAYTVTKAAQIHMMKGLAAMVGPKVRVNSMSPGLLLTDWSKRFSEEQKETHRQKTKLKRFVALEDVAEQVYATTKNRSMTGVNILMDAGFLL